LLIQSIMRAPHLIALLTVVLSGAACVTPRRPLVLTASPSDHESLIGKWSGHYTIDRQRGGLIDFELTSGKGEAFGDVLMIPRGAERAYGPRPPEAGQGGTGPYVSPEVLTIRFVRAEDGTLTGALTPYWDPDRRCTATAVFRGAVGGAAISGTFVSTCDRGAPTYTGRWQLRRRTG
jgi:hypothetical protein